MAAVKIVDVHKRHGNAAIIRGADITIEDGQFVVLVGPSGCGKSTLLRMIAGLEEVNSGEIWIGDKLVNHMPAKDRDVAMVFQNYALYPHMTVADNLAFSLSLRHAKKPVIRETVDRVAGILGLSNLLDRYPRQLSGGQRQRVAMGRAIVRDPKVFLFDEPLSNLDAKLRMTVRTEIKELHQRLRTTTIYVTHDQIEAMTMANQIVVMREGRVEQTGPPLELYDRPVNQFVAGFMGSPEMNFIPVTWTNGALRLPGGTTVPWSAPPNSSFSNYTLGIRPEHLRVAKSEAEEAFAGRVAIVEPTGSETIVIFEWEGGRLTVLVRERLDLRQGQALRLKLVAGAGHVFDPQGIRVGTA